MKNRKRNLLVAFLLCFCFISGGNTDITRRIKNEIRQGPGSFYPILAVIPKDTELEILREQKGWFNIKFIKTNETTKELINKDNLWISKNCFKKVNKKKLNDQFELEHGKISKASLAASVRGFAVRYGNISIDDINRVEEINKIISIQPDDYYKFKINAPFKKEKIKNKFEDYLTEYTTELNEDALGLNICSKFGMKGFVNNIKLNKYVNSIALNLGEVSEFYDFQFMVYIVNDKEINAAALPGGYIILTQGIIDLCENEAELTAIIAHEIIHMVLRHGLQETSQRKINLKVDESFDELEKETTDKDSISNELEEIALESYDRIVNPRLQKYENEADAGALLLLYYAGYNIQALENILKKIILNIPEEQSIENYNPFLKHDFKNRISYIKEFIKENKLKPNNVLMAERFYENCR